jgi:VanZ family protein
MKKAFKLVLTLLPFLYMIAIWIMSSNPDDMILDLPSSSFDRFIKEALHLVEFALLYILLVSWLPAAKPKTETWFKPVGGPVACLYGVIDEYHQSFVPYRTAALIDVIKDIIGVAAVYFHVHYHYFKRERGFLTIIEKIKRKNERWESHLHFLPSSYSATYLKTELDAFIIIFYDVFIGFSFLAIPLAPY